MTPTPSTIAVELDRGDAASLLWLRKASDPDDARYLAYRCIIIAGYHNDQAVLVSTDGFRLHTKPVSTFLTKQFKSITDNPKTAPFGFQVVSSIRRSSRWVVLEFFPLDAQRMQKILGFVAQVLADPAYNLATSFTAKYLQQAVHIEKFSSLHLRSESTTRTSILTGDDYAALVMPVLDPETAGKLPDFLTIFSQWR